MLGSGTFWVVILTIAFTAIDYTGIYRGLNGPTVENWDVRDFYLLGAWFLGAFLNAFLWAWAFDSIMKSPIIAAGLTIAILAIRILLIVPMFGAAARLILEKELQ